MTSQTRIFFWCLAGIMFSLSSHLFAEEIPNDFSTMFEERSKAVVAVSYIIEHEVDRESREARAVVTDDEGHLVLLDGSIPYWLPPEQMKDFRVHIPLQSGEGYEATYLGMDYLTNWHYLQVEEAARDQLVPITSFETARPKLGEFLWGMGMMGKDYDYELHFMSGRLGVIQAIPLEHGMSLEALASPGLPIFNAKGQLTGWAAVDIYQEVYLYGGNGRSFGASLQRVDESSSFLLAEEFLRYYDRIPEKPAGNPRPWIGVAGLQPLDNEAASFLGLEGQGAVVISDVLEDSPAAEGGLQARDIIVGIDGEPLRKLRPAFVTLQEVQRLIGMHEVGEEITFSVVRGDETVEIKTTVGEDPMSMREAPWEYFSEVGMSLRPFLLHDAVRLRTLKLEDDGAIVRYVKPNSPADSAGLRGGDWLKEVDGTPVNNYEAAVEAMNQLLADESRQDFVLLVKRENDTKVLRVKLN